VWFGPCRVFSNVLFFVGVVTLPCGNRVRVEHRLRGAKLIRGYTSLADTYDTRTDPVHQLRCVAASPPSVSALKRNTTIILVFFNTLSYSSLKSGTCQIAPRLAIFLPKYFSYTHPDALEQYPYPSPRSREGLPRE
jgi:hypothetical protein